MEPTVVLITGASRGIGRGLIGLYAAKPNHKIIAANRDPSHQDSQELLDLPKGEGTTVHLVKVDATSQTDASQAAKLLKARGVNHVDILIVNAGIAYVWPKLEEVKIDDIKDHFETNVYGFVRLYQAFLPFLKGSSDAKLVMIGSSAAFLKNVIPFPNAAYGATKIVQHWYTRTVSIAEPWLTAFPIDPGFVQTEMGNRGARSFSLEKASISIDESVQGVVKVIDESSLKTHSGRLWKWTGEEEPW